MFTGLVEACVPVRAWEPVGTGARLVLPAPAEDRAPEDGWSVSLGESVAVAGCCLTVTEVAGDGAMTFDLSRETLERTWFGGFEVGRLVNLERSVRPNDRLGGHLVSGHVDGVGRIAGIDDSGDGGQVFTFEVPPDFARYLIEKGSVGIDGISLTVVEPEGTRFGVAVIPETLARTNLGEAAVDQAVHLEADQIGKWVERLLRDRDVC